MKKMISVVLCLVLVFSLSSVAFAASISPSNCSLQYLEEYEPGKYRFTFSYDEVTNKNYLSLLQEFYPQYRAAIGDDTKTIFVGSMKNMRSFNLYVLENAEFKTYTLSSGGKVYWCRGDGFKLTIGLDAHNKVSTVSRLLISSTDTYSQKIGLGLESAGSTIAYYAIQGNFGHSSKCDMITGVSGFEVVESSDLPASLPHNLTINYKYPDGSQAAESVTQTFDSGAEYSIESPAVEGYRADKPFVSGIMPDEDLTIDVTYSKSLYNLHIQYRYEDGSQALPDFQSSYLYGFSYSVDSPEIAGYLPDKATISGIMPGRDMIETVIYRKIIVPQYTLTISYQYEDGSQALQTVQQQYQEGESYSILTPEIEGYKADKSMIAGVMPGSNISHTVIYKKDSSISPGPGSGGTGGDGNPWENIDSGPKYDPFHNFLAFSIIPNFLFFSIILDVFLDIRT